MRRYIHLLKNVDNWWLHFFHKWRVTAQDPIRYRLRNRVSFDVPVRLLHEFKEVVMDECYSSLLPTSLPPTPLIIDIGANAGFFTLFAASRFAGARIYAYEPVPVNYRQLKRNVDLNPKLNIHIFQKAIFSHTGELQLAWDPVDSFTTSATLVDQPEAHLETSTVPCLSLEDLFETHGIEQCDFLKMDCEGSEHPILLNCSSDTLHKISRAAIEVHAGPEPSIAWRHWTSIFPPRDSEQPSRGIFSTPANGPLSLERFRIWSFRVDSPGLLYKPVTGVLPPVTGCD